MRPALRDILLADRFYPGAYFAADFTKRKYRLGGQRYSRFLDIPGASFTRASTGYALNALGGLVNYASGDLRQVDDRGLLVEGARTNLLLQSQTLDNASWTKNRSSISANAIAAPDGTTTADKLVEDNTATNTHMAAQTVTVSSGVLHTYSVYAKAGERTWLALYDNVTGKGKSFDLTNGAVGSTIGGAPDAATIEALGGGWFRCVIQVTTASTSFNAQLYLCPSTAVTSYTGDGASGLYLWGAQLEAATGASSYIPTTTASATRAADLPAIAGSFSSTATLLAEFETEIIANTGANQHLLCLDDGTTANRLQLTLATGIAPQSVNFANTSGNVVQTNITGSTQAPAGVNKFAGAAAVGDQRAYQNGVQAASGAPAAVPVGPLANLRLGTNQAGAVNGFLYLRRVAIYASALSNAQLQALTA